MSRIVYTAGVFDLLHEGHLNILERSKEYAGPGGFLVVGVISDEGAAAYKRRPVQREAHRIRVIKSLRFVDAVLMQMTTDPTPIVRWLMPAAMTHGDDWTKLREGQETLERLGIEWKLFPHTPDVSTTAFLEVLKR